MLLLAGLKQPWAWAVAEGHMPLINSDDDGYRMSGRAYIGIVALPGAPSGEDVSALSNRIGIDKIPPEWAESAVIGVAKLDFVNRDSLRLPVWYRQWRDPGKGYCWGIKDSVSLPQPVELDLTEQPDWLWDATEEQRDMVFELYRDKISQRLMNRLYTRRKEQRITQAELAGVLGYTTRHMHNLEKSATGSIQRAILLLDVLGYPVTDY